MFVVTSLNFVDAVFDDAILGSLVGTPNNSTPALFSHPSKSLLGRILEVWVGSVRVKAAVKRTTHGHRFKIVCAPVIVRQK